MLSQEISHPLATHVIRLEAVGSEFESKMSKLVNNSKVVVIAKEDRTRHVIHKLLEIFSSSQSIPEEVLTLYIPPATIPTKRIGTSVRGTERA